MTDRHPEKVNNVVTPLKKKPYWIRSKIIDTQNYFKTKERCKNIKEFFKIKKIKYYEIINTDENILSKLINLIYLLDYATIYKAVLLQRNPTPVESIDFIKRKLMD